MSKETGVCSQLNTVINQGQFYDSAFQQILSIRKVGQNEDKIVIGTEVAITRFSQERGLFSILKVVQ